MKLHRLANFLDIKYNLISNAIIEERTVPNIQEVLRSIKGDLVTAYNLYVNDDVPVENPFLVATSGMQINKDKVIPLLASYDEPNSKFILKVMKQLVENIGSVDANITFMAINKVLEKIEKNFSEIIKYIENISNLDKTIDLNFRKALIAKAKNTFKRLSSLLEQQYKKLSKYVDKPVVDTSRVIVPNVAPISRDQLRLFTYTPEAQEFGLTDLDILEKALDRQGMRELITNVINAIKRGHRPSRGSELERQLSEIRQIYQEKEQLSNKKYFEPEESEIFEE